MAFIFNRRRQSRRNATSDQRPATSDTGEVGPDRLMYLDGMRGVAALIVVVFHCVAQFRFPWISGPFGSGGPPHWLTGSPANLAIGGNIAVCLFFVHSGLVLTLPHVRNQVVLLRGVADMAIRRPIRLLGPIAAMLLLTFVLATRGAFRVNERAAAVIPYETIQTANMRLEGLPWQVWIWAIAGPSVLLREHRQLSPVLWTMYFEFVGSFIVFALAAICPVHVRRRQTIACGTAVFLLLTNRLYLAAFPIGFLLAEWLTSQTRVRGLSRKLVRHRPGLVAIFTLGLYLGSSPAYSTPFFSPLWVGDFTVKSRVIALHVAGASLLLAGVLMSGLAQRVLSAPLLRRLGRISFSLYLVHPLVLYSAGNQAYVNLLGACVPEPACAILATAAVVCLSLLAATLFTNMVDTPSIRTAKLMSAALGLRQDSRRL